MKDNAEFTFKLGIVDGKVISVEEITALATLPGKEELFSKLLFLIKSPAQRLATVINATGRDLAVVINQGVEKGKFAGPAACACRGRLPLLKLRLPKQLPPQRLKRRTWKRQPQASSLRARRSRRTQPHRRAAKLPP